MKGAISRFLFYVIVITFVLTGCEDEYDEYVGMHENNYVKRPYCVYYIVGDMYELWDIADVSIAYTYKYDSQTLKVDTVTNDRWSVMVDGLCSDVSVKMLMRCVIKPDIVIDTTRTYRIGAFNADIFFYSSDNYTLYYPISTYYDIPGSDVIPYITNVLDGHSVNVVLP